MRSRVFLFIALVAILLAACANSASSNDTDPVITDPPQPEEKYAEFSVVVTRIGEQAPFIGWNASGVVYLKVLLGTGGGANVTGIGVGTAGFDASSQACIDAGGWPVEYTAYGSFDEDKCVLTIMIEETWPQTEAHYVCMGAASSYAGGVYKLMFPSLNFTEKDPREDTATTLDMITWVNTFKLYHMKGLEETSCVFDTPAP